VTTLAGVSDPLGDAVESVLGLDVLRAPETDGGRADAIVLETSSGERYFAPEVTRLGKASAPSGSLIVLRDVTDLKQRERDLDRLQGVTSRFLRHNLRNDLSVVSGYANTIAERTQGDVEAFARDIAATADGVIDKSNKAHVVERVIEHGDERRPVEVTTIVHGSVQAVGEQFPEVTFDTRLPDDAWASASPFLTEAVRNVVENAAKHCDAADPAVTIVVEAEDDRVRTAISDNGSGIPATEVAVVQRGRESELTHGSGIGLYLVAWIVEKSGGRLEFEEEHSTVVLDLPATRPP
jgi:signal transduction histidine kinase